MLLLGSLGLGVTLSLTLLKGNGVIALGLAVILSWTLAPLVSLFVPLYASRHGAEAMLSFSPPGLMLWLGWLALRMWAPRWSVALCLGLGLIGANIGAEHRRRAKPD